MERHPVFEKRYISVKAVGTDLMRTITACDDWDWARPAPKLHELVQNLENIKNVSKFWGCFVLNDFSTMKKDYSKQQLVEEIAHAQRVENAITDLEVEAAVLKNKHEAGLSARGNK